MEHEQIEKKWQAKWAGMRLGEAEPDKSKKKFFMIFAYPGISGYLHVGHMRGYSYTDVICRYKRMTGHNVLFPVGTHASGNQAISFAKKVKNKDEKWLGYLKRNGCNEEKIKEMMSQEKIVEYFNEVYVNDYWKRFGFLCDWRRFTSTINQDYQKFIQWQFKKLYHNNLLVQKPYFATFCPECGPVAVDPSETDISKGGNAETNEYVLLKFKFGDLYLVAATLRPETIYGQTNLWVREDCEYVKAQVGDETWVMSQQAADKLGYQKDGIKVINKINGEDLLGKKAIAPGIDRQIIILPSKFVNPDVGTGIVTSVPSDAPYDYMAIEDLKKTEDKYGVKQIDLIPIIISKGYGRFPAKDICEKMGIKSQEDKEKLDQATAEIYKVGFHKGIMNDNCGKYSGKPVAEAKELIKQELLENGQADIIRDLSEEVICRCQTRVVIKRIDDQWFIKYSDSELTKKSRGHAKNMLVTPDDYYQNMPAVLDWFMDRPCARLGNWIGAKLPMDEKWIVEPISDSTLYPMYYLVSKYVNTGSLKTEQLTEEFFDYIFLNKGKAEEVSEKTNVDASLLEKIQKDYEYWYPLDINLGGKEHKTVHFPVFLMNHVAVLDDAMWPKGIFVNYWVVGKGSKISKSKGGAEPIPGAVKKYSVDGMRLFYCHSGNAHSEIVWDEELVLKYKKVIERIYNLAHNVLELEGKKSNVDKWLISRLNKRVKTASKSMENLELREATTDIFFGIYEDLKWYQRRGGNNAATIKEAIKNWAKLMCPMTPHLAEELNHKLDGELVSNSTWPEYDEEKIELDVEATEEMISNAVKDITNVMNFVKIENPKKAKVIVAQEWKYNFYEELKKQFGITRNAGEIIKEIMNDQSLREKAKDVNKIILACIKDPSKLPEFVTSQQEEFKSLKESVEFLQKETGMAIEIEKAEESSEQKANAGIPGKPAIVIQ